MLRRSSRGLALAVLTSAGLYLSTAWLGGSPAFGIQDLHPGPALLSPEAAASRLLEEINLSTSAPTRSHEQRVELLHHIRDRIEAELSTPEACHG
ncbi:hypothetical protein SAMN02745194_03107 [Roseomonas rosea]|uniref:Uncharacterized protein n=1 Tax=Muricoccus roseus TaxID=198092 RepID=A0A1M6LAN0_9PROT|nr:hypothetical protein [Roseomonas rosea]SHJ68258.1 hypothetical protein SAMN02745194_03107 [Roseomonas rosea]